MKKVNLARISRSMSGFDKAMPPSNGFEKAQPGGMLSRQMSTSHVTPRSLSGYQDFFRQNSTREDGFLSLKVGKTGQYEERYVAFEDSTLSVYSAPGSTKLFSISMDSVVSFRTDVSRRPFNSDHSGQFSHFFFPYIYHVYRPMLRERR